MARPLATQSGWVRTEREGERLLLSAGGSWVISTLSDLDRRLRALAPGSVRRARIDMGAIDDLDTAGAWVLFRTQRRLRDLGIDTEFADVRPSHRIILERIARGDTEAAVTEDRYHPIRAAIERLGAATIAAFDEAVDLLNFLGVVTVAALRSLGRPGQIRFVSLISHIEQVGLNAMPIVGLLSFLIGVVLAYQGADQLARFGAEIFTVNLLGVSMLREMGIMMTAVLVAGRSGSAFAAQIGTMQVNEEVDAMRAIGLDPVEVLVLPRIFALLLAMPLLAMFSSLMGLVGGGLMVIALIDISVVQFIERLNSAVPVWSFWIGIIKAPVFGFLIGLVGCREGLKVSGSAESVGRQTTKAVVVSIFLVILADALFSIFFSAVGV